jgi:hypothetical protein
MNLISVHLDEARELLQRRHTLAKVNSASKADSTTAAKMVLSHFILPDTLLKIHEVERIERDEQMSSFCSQYSDRKQNLWMNRIAL